MIIFVSSRLLAKPAAVFVLTLQRLILARVLKYHGVRPFLKSQMHFLRQFVVQHLARDELILECGAYLTALRRWGPASQLTDGR